jgi:hypothetical protein
LCRERGQAGSDQAGLRAARACGISTGGWAPLGWETEDGPAPWLADFGLTECPEPGDPARTRANVRDSDGTVWFGSIASSGYRTTHDAAVALSKPFLIVDAGDDRPGQVRDWIEARGVRVLNCAGDREGVSPGIGEWTERFMLAVLR